MKVCQGCQENMNDINNKLCPSCLNNKWMRWALGTTAIIMAGLFLYATTSMQDAFKEEMYPIPRRGKGKPGPM